MGLLTQSIIFSFLVKDNKTDSFSSLFLIFAFAINLVDRTSTEIGFYLIDTVLKKDGRPLRHPLLYVTCDTDLGILVLLLYSQLIKYFFPLVGIQ